ncbi:MAG TPA: sensor histidine kinase [Bryobacteraceae bacterium]|nr:sensor histidine kinase [Bryobacteraceae bacterium]
MQFFRFLTWRRTINLARVALAGWTVGKVSLFAERTPVLLYLALVAYLVYAGIVAVRNSWPTGTFGPLVLFADTVFFLVLAGFWPAELLWPATLFYLLLLLEATTCFGPAETFLVLAACTGFCLLAPGGRALDLARTALVAGVITCIAAAWKGRSEAAMATLKMQVSEAQKAKVKAVEEERQRIASDFHDGPLQSFISLQMRLDILRRLLERDMAAGIEDLRQLQALAQSQVRDLRAFLNSMRPAEIDSTNLMAAARRTAEHFQKESGIPVTFLGGNSQIGLPRETAGEVLQMLREALHNVQKHSGATRVAVAMDKTERGLEVSIDDNGRGFAFAGAYSLDELELLRLGPASLKRRARALNAELVLESRPGRGAGVKFRVPL